MNRDEAKAQGEIKLAWAQRTPIQYQPPYTDEWTDVTGDDIVFDFDKWKFRIKPKPRTFWIVEWPTRWHVYQSLDCAIAAARQQIDGTPGQVITTLEVLP